MASSVSGAIVPFFGLGFFIRITSSKLQKGSKRPHTLTITAIHQDHVSRKTNTHGPRKVFVPFVQTQSSLNLPTQALPEKINKQTLRTNPPGHLM